MGEIERPLKLGAGMRMGEMSLMAAGRQLGKSVLTMDLFEELRKAERADPAAFAQEYLCNFETPVKPPHFSEFTDAFDDILDKRKNRADSVFTVSTPHSPVMHVTEGIHDELRLTMLKGRREPTMGELRNMYKRYMFADAYGADQPMLSKLRNELNDAIGRRPARVSLDFESDLYSPFHTPKFKSGGAVNITNSVNAGCDSSVEAIRKAFNSLRFGNISRSTNEVNHKEFQMNVSILEELANVNKDEYTPVTGLPASSLRDAIQARVDAEKAAKIERAADSVMELLRGAESRVQREVTSIRQARAAEEASKKKLAEINRAKAYGMASQNFIPLAVVLGYAAVPQGSTIGFVPETFVANTEETPVAKSGTKTRTTPNGLKKL